MLTADHVAGAVHGKTTITELREQLVCWRDAGHAKVEVYRAVLRYRATLPSDMSLPADHHTLIDEWLDMISGFCHPKMRVW